MKEIYIQLNKDEALSIKRGNNITYFFDNTKVVVQGPPPVRKPKKGRPRRELDLTDIKLT